MKNTFTLLLTFLTIQLFSQTFTELPSMPEPVSNNAVTEGLVNGVPHVYSFSGIDETKIYSGIHKKAFRYNTQTQVWEEIAELPSGNGRIAAGASTVKNKIYIIGGYEVFANGSEVSVDKVHIYNPETNTYEPDGTSIPVAIDDQVQAVWRDSLIYVVTGWSDSQNVPNVQIYNPFNDEWLIGTSVPNNNDYMAFGASGAIIGDTIFYIGGARFSASFPITNQIRKGVIDPNDPTNVTWSVTPNAAASAYRAAVYSRNDGEIFWIGGSDVTYNFNGIAYNGSGGVAPRTNWRRYQANVQSLMVEQADMFGNEMPEVMDLRGLAVQPDGTAIIAGGMLANQTVTDKVFQIQFEALLSARNLDFPSIKISPNPTNHFFQIQKEGNFDIKFWDNTGRLIFSKNKNGFEEINISNLNTGIYHLKIFEDGEWIGIEKLVVN